MVKCSFCGTTLSPGTGTMYVKKDGKVLYFDSGKCQKNLLTLKRNPLNTKWSKLHKKK